MPAPSASHMSPSALRNAAAVMTGGLLGSAARAGVAAALPTPAGGFPLATLAVNVGGSFLLGLYLARRQRSVVRPWTLQLWGIGALGSFTTFSTFSVEVFRMLHAGSWALAVGYVVASMAGGLTAALFGERLGVVLA